MASLTLTAANVEEIAIGPASFLARAEIQCSVMGTGFPLLSKFTIPPKKTVKITDHPTANTTLWVDSGSVHLADDEDEHPLMGGPIAVDNGPVVVTNPNAKAAVVFA